MPTFNYPQDFSGTLWLVLDGDVYVSSTGSDDTGNGSPSNPYATIQKGIDVASSNNKIVVGTGDYNEQVNGAGKDNVIVADGIVIMHGNENVTAFSNMGSGTQSRLEGFYIAEYAIAIDNKIANVVNCTIKESSLEDYRGTLQNCILDDVLVRATANTYLYNCTFINVITEDFVTKTKFKEIQNCHFDSQTVIYIKSSNTTYFNYCNQEVGSVVNVDTIDYFNAGVLYAAFPLFQEHGLSVLPQFSNPSKGDFSLQSSSPLIGSGSSASFIGAVGLANAQNIATLGGATLVNVTINGDGKYELVQGYKVGTVETEEIDVGSKRVLGKINLFANEHFETPPYNAVVDKNNANTQPNQITFEMRYSDFQGDILNKPYLEFVWNKQPRVDASGKGNGNAGFDPLSAFPINTRYVQLRITLRDDTHFLLQENSFCILQEDSYGILV